MTLLRNEALIFVFISGMLTSFIARAAEEKYTFSGIACSPEVSGSDRADIRNTALIELNKRLAKSHEEGRVFLYRSSPETHPEYQMYVRSPFYISSLFIDVGVEAQTTPYGTLIHVYSAKACVTVNSK